MKITIQRSTLLDRLAQVVKAAPSKPAIPILDGVLIESSAVLTLTASDSRNEIHTTLDDYMEHAAGSTVIPAKKLLEVIKKMPEKEIAIEVANGKALIKCGKAKVELPTLDAEEFPRKEKPEGEPITLDGSAFASLVQSTSYAASTNEQSPILMGVCLQLSDGTITAVATDRHRLGRHEISAAVEGNAVYVVPAKMLDEVAKTKPKVADIWLRDSAIHIKAGDFHYAISLLDGTYPDTSKLMPQSHTTAFTVNREALFKTLELADKVNDEKTKVVKLEIGSGEIKLTVRDGDSSMEESLEAEVEGEDITISANAKYLADALKVMDCEKVVFKLNGAMRPMIIEPVGQSGVLHLVLPYRTTV